MDQPAGTVAAVPYQSMIIPTGNGRALKFPLESVNTILSDMFNLCILLLGADNLISFLKIYRNVSTYENPRYLNPMQPTNTGTFNIVLGEKISYRAHWVFNFNITLAVP
jgi:hypothetical protein